MIYFFTWLRRRYIMFQYIHIYKRISIFAFKSIYIVMLFHLLSPNISISILVYYAFISQSIYISQDIFRRSYYMSLFPPLLRSVCLFRNPDIHNIFIYWISSYTPVYFTSNGDNICFKAFCRSVAIYKTLNAPGKL